nr:MAG TPA: hypothetical protein [Caudoviricetes sp.]
MAIGDLNNLDPYLVINGLSHLSRVDSATMIRLSTNL